MNKGVFVCRVSLKDKDVASVTSEGRTSWVLRNNVGNGHV